MESLDCVVIGAGKYAADYLECWTSDLLELSSRLVRTRRREDLH